MTIGAHGDVRLRLRPDWHAESAAYVAALAADARACEDACEVYRVEPGFLVQGNFKERVGGEQYEDEGGTEVDATRRRRVGGRGTGDRIFSCTWARSRRRTSGGDTRCSRRWRTRRRWRRWSAWANAPSSTPGGTGTMRFIDERPRITLRDARSKGAARA